QRHSSLTKFKADGTTKLMPSNLQLQKYNWFMLIAGFIIAILYSYGHLIDGDVIQNMNKAHAFVTQGKITAYGNISGSGMSGNVPGVFLTLIAGLPMKIWFSPWAALAMIALLHFFALLMMIDVLKNYLSPIGITALYVFFWLDRKSTRLNSSHVKISY